MLREAIEKILSIAECKTFEIGESTYSTQTLRRVEPHVDRPESIDLTGLDSLAKLIREELPRINTTVFVRVCGATKVQAFTSYQPDYSRNYLYNAVTDVPGFREGFREREKALIELRSLFIPGNGVKYLLELLSRVSENNSVSTQDNGVSQTVEIKQGVALRAVVDVEPRVCLQPFRTFLEVPQPESEFLLRLNEKGDVGLFEADGGVWKLEAKRNIMAYMESLLDDLIHAGKVIVMM